MVDDEGYAGVAQLVERQPSKLNVAGSNPVSRSEKTRDISMHRKPPRPQRHPNVTAHLAQW